MPIGLLRLDGRDATRQIRDYLSRHLSSTNEFHPRRMSYTRRHPIIIALTANVINQSHVYIGSEVY